MYKSSIVNLTALYAIFFFQKINTKFRTFLEGGGKHLTEEPERVYAT